MKILVDADNLIKINIEYRYRNFEHPPKPYLNKDLKNMSETTKPYKKRHGIIAIDKGFITSQQLIEASSHQVMKEVKDGEHYLIGAILFDLGHITLEQDAEVLTELSKH